MVRVLYGGKTQNADEWRAALLTLRPDLDIAIDPETCDSEKVDILLYEPSGPIQDLSAYANVSAIQSLWAGVETLLENTTLPDEPPVLRMVEDGLTMGMTDYVVGHVYRAHLGVSRQQEDQRNQKWSNEAPLLSKHRHIGIVGLGALGRYAAETLASLGFHVHGWSRTQKQIDRVECLSGAGGFDRLLRQSEIIVLLAPLTPQTTGMVDANALRRMPQGAHLINAARGQLVNEEALLTALDTGHIATATLDVFHTEPLPTDHPFWHHPRVLVTPHIASATRIETAAQTIVEQIERLEAGKPFLHIVDREKGY